MRLFISRRLDAMARKRRAPKRAPSPLYPLATLIAAASEGDKLDVIRRELDRLDRKEARGRRR